MTSSLLLAFLLVTPLPTTRAPAQADAEADARASVRPARMRCESLFLPLAVAERVPHLSFELDPLDGMARGQRMTAWQVCAASDPRALEAGATDLWDSGRVAGDDPTTIEWGGAPLASGQEVHWRVRVWDERDRLSDWSPTVWFRVGLLDESDWSAQWIGFDAPLAEMPGPPTLDGAEWIGHPDDELASAPAAERWYRTRFDLAPDAEIASAQLVLTADNELALHVNGERVALEASEANEWRRTSAVDLTERLRGGTNVLACSVRNTEPGPAGLVAKLVVRTADGAQRVIASGPSWRASDTAEPGWAAADLAESDAWKPARSHGAYPTGPWGRVKDGGLHLPPPRLLRGSFDAPAKPVRRAILYASALGLHDVTLNGERWGDEWFLPGWTDYTKRVPYHAWDVTNFLVPGENVLATVLADGWFAGYIGYGNARHHYGERTRFLAQLVMEHEDGTKTTVGTDERWRASTGPWLEADFLMGESYDARAEMPGWDRPGFDASSWSAVDVGAPFATRLEPHRGPAVRAFEELAPVSRREIAPGTWIYDLGQNFAGVVRLRVRGAPGGVIRVRYAERLDEHDELYTANLRGARSIDTYVCRSDDVEEWTPHFTFHGFQYVEISGVEGEPPEDAVTGLALSSDTWRTGMFRCSDERVSRLVQNAYWTQRANFIDVPTDCPQRDERLGWTGDAQAYVRTASMLCDVQAFFRKWLVDLEDAQRADGQFPMVAPLKVAGGDGGPAWADAGVICPWTIWEVYGDRRDLARRYDSMRRFVEFTRARSTPDLLPPEKFHCFGDWLHVDDPTPNEVIYQAYFAASAQRLAWTAEVLGKHEDAAQALALAHDVAAAFRRAYVAEDGRIHGDSQTAYVLALAYDLVEGELAAKCADRLLEKLAERGWKLSTGFVGTKDLMLVLAKIGRNDVAYRLLQHDEYPSWLFPLRQGATSIWERWNGWTPEQGFADPGMNSFAHYAFGAVVQWIFENVGGIRASAPGYAVITIRPQPGGTITSAHAYHHSPRGPIETSWELLGPSLLLSVRIPPGTTARVHVPTSDASSVREEREPIGESAHMRVLETTPDEVVIEVAPGSYTFRAESPVVRRM